MFIRNYKNSHTRLNLAIDAANILLNNEEFYTLIKEHGEFPMANVNGEIIGDELKKDLDREIMINQYTPKNPFSKALACFRPSQPNDIFLSSRKINRSIASLVGSIIHEYIHLSDKQSPYSYGHGSNSRKPMTAPYWIGALAKGMTMGLKAPEKKIRRAGFWKRLRRFLF